MSRSGFIPAHGGYRELLAYQKAEVIYDITFRFCQRCLSRGDRTVDQMVQAARSGKQNIAEGSQASGTSKESELKLTGVARASLEELLIDFHDFLRVRDLPVWKKDSKQAVFVRRLGRAASPPAKSHGSHRSHESFETYRDFIESRPADVVANIAICLINQANYLLDQQIRRLERDFVKQGGLRERMTRARLEHRGRWNQVRARTGPEPGVMLVNHASRARRWVRVGDIPRYALMPSGKPCGTTYFYRDLARE